MQCPNCGAQLDLSLIPREEFYREVGRRRVQKRQKASGVPKGSIKVWRRHNPNSGTKCFCEGCWEARLRRLEGAIDQAIARDMGALGIPLDAARTYRMPQIARIQTLKAKIKERVQAWEEKR